MIRFITLRKSRSFTPLLSLSGLFIILLIGFMQSVFAAPFKDTFTPGSWNDGANWNPAGVPVDGQSVNIDLAMVVNSNAEFGDNSEMSIWAGPNGTTGLTINSGVTLTHDPTSSGSTFILPNTATDLRLAGDGILLNRGTMQLNGPRFIVGISGAPKINNEGDFNITSSGSRIELFSNGSRFNNLAGGDFNVTLPIGGIARIMGTPNVDGQFVQSGNAINIAQGILVFAPPNGIGGTLDDAAFSSLFGAAASPIGPNSELRIAGGFSNITLTGGTKLERVRLGSSTDPINVLAGGMTLNVSGTGIKTSNSGTVTLETGAARTLTNQGTLVLDTGSDFRMQGTGALTNTGTVQHQNARFIIGISGSPAVNNSNNYNFTESGGRAELFSNGSRFNNLPGGTINVTLPIGGIARIMGTPNVDGQFKQTGNPINIAQGILVFAPPNGIGGTLNDAAFSSLFGASASPIGPNSELRIAGGFSNIQLTGGTKLDRVRLGSSTDPINVRSGGMILNVSGTGIRTSNSGTVTLETGAARTLTNQGTLVLDTSSDFRMQGTGSLDNTGYIQHRNARFIIGITGSPAVNNSGLYEFTESGGRAELFLTGSSFNNLDGGIVRAAMPTAGSLGRIFRNAGSSATFTNLGIAESTGGILRVEASVTAPQITSNSLTGGTWRVLADSVDATLDLLASGTGIGGPAAFDGTITTIASGAKVVLSRQGTGNVFFPQLGAVQTLGGEYYVHGDLSLPVHNAMTVTGTLGGDGQFDTPGTITFNGGVLDPSALNGGPGTLAIDGNLTLSDTTQLNFSLGTGGIVGSGVNDLVYVDGDLVLDGVLDITQLPGFGSGAYRLFEYTGSFTDEGLTILGSGYVLDLSTFGQVNLLLVPEPSTGLLLFTGVALIRRRKRNR